MSTKKKDTTIKVNRDAGTGRFVTPEYAKKHPKTTVTETVRRPQKGLGKVMGGRDRGRGFQLRKATFKGEGLQPEAAGASWERLRELTYGGRGG